MKTEAHKKRLATLTKRKWQHIRDAETEREYIRVPKKDLRFLIIMAGGELER